MICDVDKFIFTFPPPGRTNYVSVLDTESLKVEIVFFQLVSMNKFNGSKAAKMKKYIPYIPCNKNYREEAVGVKTSNYSFKITIFL